MPIRTVPVIAAIREWRLLSVLRSPSTVHIIASQHPDSAFSQAVIGNNGKKVLSMPRFASASAMFASLPPCLPQNWRPFGFFHGWEGQAKHDLSYGNEYVRILTRIFTSIIAS